MTAPIDIIQIGFRGLPDVLNMLQLDTDKIKVIDEIIGELEYIKSKIVRKE